MCGWATAAVFVEEQLSLTVGGTTCMEGHQTWLSIQVALGLILRTGPCGATEAPRSQETVPP